MHEYSLVRSLLNQMEAICRQHDAARITAVDLSVGEFSGVDADLLQSAFEQLSAERWPTPIRLVVTRVPLTATCGPCQKSFPVQQFHFVCPVCQANDVTISSGEGLVLERVRLTTDAT